MRQQLLYFLRFALSLPLLPVLYVQGRRARKRVPKLPEAPGSEGVTGNGTDPLRLLTLGESTVAGVGMPDHRVGFAGRIAAHLAERAGRSVAWRVVARSGYAARDVTQRLVPLIPGDPQDLIVIGLGGNDTFQLNSPRRWRRDMIALVGAIRERQPECPIVIANLPPVGEFPAFPPLMQGFLGALVRLHGDAIADLPARLPGVHYVARRIRLRDWIEQSDRPIVIDDLFCDGVHPSALTYDLWTREIVEHAWPRIEG